VQRQVVRLTRGELYEKMWSRPAIALAEEFGISGRGLGKICTRFEIPVPPRGYWAKLAVGKHVTRVPQSGPVVANVYSQSDDCLQRPEQPGARLRCGRSGLVGAIWWRQTHAPWWADCEIRGCPLGSGMSR